MKTSSWVSSPRPPPVSEITVANSPAQHAETPLGSTTMLKEAFLRLEQPDRTARASVDNTHGYFALIVVSLSCSATVPAAVDLLPGHPVTLGRSRDNTIVLRDELASRLHAKVYYEDGRWLLAPPPAEFWGRPVINRGPRLTLIYPERDEEIGGRLAVYLEQLVSQLCAPAAGLGCPADWQLEIELATEPAALLGVVLRNGREMKLPAPSLVGAPLDEAGYTALRRAYGTALATGLVMEFGGSVCCGYTSPKKRW